MAITRPQFIAFLKVFPIVLLVSLGLFDILSRIFTGTGAFTPDTNAVAEVHTALAAEPAQIVSAIIPAELSIPSIGVQASVEKVGRRPDGTMGIPSSMKTVGWFTGGYKPGDMGNAVIDGHLDNALGTDAVFKHLGELQAGDSVYVTDASGATLRFVVRERKSYDYKNAPTSELFGTQGKRQLLLVTCEGDWNPREHSYDKRLVVFAELAS